MSKDKKYDDGRLDEKAGKRDDIVGRIGQILVGGVITAVGATFLAMLNKDNFSGDNKR